MSNNSLTAVSSNTLVSVPSSPVKRDSMISISGVKVDALPRDFMEEVRPRLSL